MKLSLLSSEHLFRMLVCGFMLMSISLVGCKMFENIFFPIDSEDSPNSKIKLKKKLEGPSGRLDVVKLEVFLVERPLSDPLLEKNGVWSELGFLGPLSNREKKSLDELGFRVGHSAANPPAKLETILALGKERSRFQLASSRTKVSSNLITLLSDAETELQTSPNYPRCLIELPTTDGLRSREFSNARCLLKVRAKRIQDGWATLEFSPEIQHGEMKWQAAPVVDGGWAGHTAQNVESLFNHRFSVTLNLGEMVAIGVDTESTTSLGKHFFIGADENSRVQRLIVVRLVDLPEIKAEE